MNIRLRTPLVLALTVANLASAGSAAASFHFMQVEQIIAGVDGSTAPQAVQVRMRSGNQNLVSAARLVAHDAAGANPIVLHTIPTNVSGSAAGSRVLLATAGFASATNPSITPDFTLVTPIPDTYIAAGSLTFESDGGLIYWRVSWGGAAYTGATTGSTTNDADGNFGPAFGDPLPTDAGQAMRFLGAASALSTNNAADYALSAGPAVFTNNAGASGTVVSLVGVPDSPAGGLALSTPMPNPVRGSMTYGVTLPRASRVQVNIFDLAGRRVRVLADRDLPAGRNSLTWDPAASEAGVLPGGVYFLRVRAGGEQRTTRFVLLGRGAPMVHPDDD